MTDNFHISLSDPFLLERLNGRLIFASIGIVKSGKASLVHSQAVRYSFVLPSFDNECFLFVGQLFIISFCVSEIYGKKSEVDISEIRLRYFVIFFIRLTAEIL